MRKGCWGRAYRDARESGQWKPGEADGEKGEGLKKTAGKTEGAEERQCKVADSLAFFQGDAGASWKGKHVRRFGAGHRLQRQPTVCCDQSRTQETAKPKSACCSLSGALFS